MSEDFKSFLELLSQLKTACPDVDPEFLFQQAREMFEQQQRQAEQSHQAAIEELKDQYQQALLREQNLRKQLEELKEKHTKVLKESESLKGEIIFLNGMYSGALEEIKHLKSDTHNLKFEYQYLEKKNHRLQIQCERLEEAQQQRLSNIPHEHIAPACARIIARIKSHLASRKHLLAKDELEELHPALRENIEYNLKIEGLMTEQGEFRKLPPLTLIDKLNDSIS